MKPLLAIAVILSCLFQTPAQAEIARELTWDDLIPLGAPIDDPVQELTLDQGIELELIARIRAKRKLGIISSVSDEAEWGIELEHKLKEQGLDVEGLLDRYTKMQIEIRELNDKVVQTLDGQMVRMPGYVLPLEFEGESIEEFLLVPYVGACIHVPAPPRNQMVLVRLNQSYAINDQYEPVWITGRMKTRAVDVSLSVFDGQIDVGAGYVLDGLRVEPYEE